MIHLHLFFDECASVGVIRTDIVVNLNDKKDLENKPFPKKVKCFKVKNSFKKSK